MIGVALAKRLMRMREVVPAAPTLEAYLAATGEGPEVFRHAMFLAGSEAVRRAIMLKSSTSKYQSELVYPWDAYFGIDLRPMLAGARALDLGCFNGGRGVGWFERYGLAHLSGIDVDPVFIQAAEQFAAARHVPSDYRVAVGEQLPYDPDTFDAVLSFDVFEHVQSVARALAECWRVRKPGGRLFVVFPGFYHPTEHHLSLTTSVPCLHWFIAPRTLVRAYDEIIAERGDGAYWYRRSKPELQPWERGQTINGTTLEGFLRLVRGSPWTVVLHSRRAVGSIGRNVSRRPAVKWLMRPLGMLTSVPGLREFVLHRNTFVLEKRS